MEKIKFNWKEYANCSRKASAEGMVLLKNDDKTLPLKKEDKISIFGRIQLDYYKGGMGSGGLVNVPYTIGIPEGLRAAGYKLNEELEDIYKEWVKDHPFDKGCGWATEPLSQEEMVLTEDIVEKAAKETEVAVIIIGRCAGEDKDSKPGKGAYLLRDEEETMLDLVCKSFKKTVVLLNVGGIMDMSWVDKYNPQAVLYVWQGGCEGGNAVADVVSGKVNPSGRMSDTLAVSLDSYPSTANYGNLEKNYYKEDIFVGYRYFESVAKDKVLYPFGFGLSYTDFSQELVSFDATAEKINVEIKVTNIGDVSGKESVQIYYSPASGKLSKPVINLIRYKKTTELNPGESEVLAFEFNVSEMSSYDDAGYTGEKSCFVLEPGKYEVLFGKNIRDTKAAGEINIDKLIVTEKLYEALSPIEEFERMVIRNGEIAYEKVPTRSYDLIDRINRKRPENREYTGDKGYKLVDVYDNKISMAEFVDQLSDNDLICASRGEGMCSVKVTPGIAGSFGGVTENLNKQFGIPIAGVADGPAGIRMDNGTTAFLLPIGTALACTFDEEIVTKLFEHLGIELLYNKIDSLLGPGINMHRNPLNGRNFEYFSEDPYLSGSMAVAELKGMHKYGVTGTIKHFVGNDQEAARHNANAIISERALREIYLKPFEMAVKQGDAYLIMSTYGPLNNIWTAGNFDLNTSVLRDQWGYKGMVMTDWWAKVNDERGGEINVQNTAPMIRAQNDVCMVCNSAETNSAGDTAEEGFKTGFITRGDLLRNAGNIFGAVIKSAVMKRFLGREDFEIEEINKPKSQYEKQIVMNRTVGKIGEPFSLDLDGISTEAGTNVQFPVKICEAGLYEITIKVRSDLGDLAQMNLTVSMNKTVLGVVNITGTKNEWIERKVSFMYPSAQECYFDFYFGQSGMDIGEITFNKTKDFIRH